MDTIELLNIRQWVAKYGKTFHSLDEDTQRNIALKESHTLRVAANMLSIAGTVLRNRSKVMMAEAIGLLHDIGRFPQYAQYRTFRDSISVNHGRLGAEVIENENILIGIPANERKMIMDAVRFHNAPSVPGDLDAETIFFLKMIRDADKLDIWRVFAEYYAKPAEERESAVGLGLPDTPQYTEAVLACLAKGTVASLSSLNTLNDFKIMQFTWVYDLNFPVSFRLAGNQGNIDRIISTLPNTDYIKDAIAKLKRYMRDRAQG
ncbi:MAG TPA: HD domain-containing protein [Thermodesulfovibrionales bacterium]|nr:HD domain-containing protein [Thermodesulfovibrionales bacterium]